MEKKLAIVTGGCRGIGKAIAVRLAREGYVLVIADISGPEEVISEIEASGGEAHYQRCDISSTEDRAELVRMCIESYGRIDVLVNNAGVAPKIRMDMLETTEESMDHVLDINLKGTFFLTQLVAKAMIENVDNGVLKHPKIINISSISAYTSSTKRPEYCISKAGVSMITTLFADRLAEYDILVYEIRPGIILTDMTMTVKDKYDRLFEQGLLPTARWGKPEDIAEATAALCSDSFNYSTGQVINVDGGFHLRRL